MKRILPLFLALALLLTGCTAVSTTETTSQAVSQVDSPSSALESAPESASSQLESAGEVSITDSNGSQITLDTSAPRVVAAYGSFAEAWLLSFAASPRTPWSSVTWACPRTSPWWAR